MEQPVEEDLQKLIDEYYEKYLIFGWKIVYSLDALLRTIAAVVLIISGYNDPSVYTKLFMIFFAFLMLNAINLLVRSFYN